MSKSTSARGTYHVGNLVPQLLQAANEMLEEVGPTKLSIRAIAVKVGISPTAIYHHFSNRADLLSHLAMEGFYQLKIALQNRQTHITKLGLLREASIIYFEFARSKPALYELMFGTEVMTTRQRILPELSQARDDAFNELKKIISEVLEKPLDSSEVREAALASWAYTHGLASLTLHQVFIYPENMNNEYLIDKMLQGLRWLFENKH